MKFAKIFEVKGHQVIAKYGINDDSEPVLIIETYVNGIVMSTKFGYKSREKAFEALNNKINQEMADKFFETAKKMAK